MAEISDIHGWLVAASTAIAVVVGFAAVMRKPEVPTSWIFLFGMILLGAEAGLHLWVAGADTPASAAERARRLLKLKALLPGVWLVFCLLYCRGPWRGSIVRCRTAFLSTLLMLGFAVAVGDRLVAEGDLGSGPVLLPAGRVLLVLVLLVALIILSSLEKTFRASMGITRWRIKFLCLGIALIFGVKIYALSEALIFSSIAPGSVSVLAVALLIGSVLMAVGYLRHGFGEFDIHPSRSFLQGSLTILLAGGYLVLVGVAAQGANWVSRDSGLLFRPFIVLIGMVGLAVLLLSNRVRTGLQRFTSRHFQRPEHDFRRVWRRFTRATSGVMEVEALCRRISMLISETFDALSVTTYLHDPEKGVLVQKASTLKDDAGYEEHQAWVRIGDEMVRGLLNADKAINLEHSREPWAAGLRPAFPGKFFHGGDRIVLPVVGGDQLLGLIVLADRVNAVGYSYEEFDLLDCIADQFAGALLNRTLTEEVMRARELEAFRTMSTFFVHDLKNSANQLSLMLQNLPTHFHDPEFRVDTLRGVGKTVDRINGLIEKLGAIRRELKLSTEATDLNELVRDVMASLDGQLPFVEIIEDYGDLPSIPLDREQVRSLIVNLVMNAGDAVNGDGCLTLRTSFSNRRVTLSVGDNGCGIDPSLFGSELFRPFSSTKSKGLGIGMFQCKRIVEAHKGTIHVESRPGDGTTFRVVLPAAEAKN